MTKTTDEINAEKAAKSRMDLVPPDHAELAGLAFKVGAEKHGLGPVGLGTYRIAGTEQSTVWSHWASMERHAAALKRGEMMDDGPGGTGLPHLACKCAQDAIIAALLQRPPGKVHPADRRWYAGRTDVVFAESLEEWAAQAEPATAVDPWALPPGSSWIVDCSGRAPRWDVYHTGEAAARGIDWRGISNLIAKRQAEDPPQ